MFLAKKVSDLKHYLDRQSTKGSIGFVPTMGALHAGHLSLIKNSRQKNKCSVCSIFINPSQFNDAEDFKKYPVTIDEDIHKLLSAGCDVLFLPSAEEMYPQNYIPMHYDLGYLEKILEGKFRPGHFQGVCQAVHRLLDIVKPDNLYLGQKDFQQAMVISRLVQLIGLDKTVTINICPTNRESDGLAMSSRNMRLSADERQSSTAIYKALNYIKDNLKEGSIETLKNEAKNMLQHKGFKVDYIEIADAETLEILSTWDGKRKTVALAAAFLNKVRLIDNMLLN